MKSIKHVIRIALCSLLLVAGSAGAQQYNAPEAEGEGEIQGLNFGTYRALIGGYQYDVSQSVQVQIGGTFGAFTMLTEGMLVEFTFLQFSDGVRQITYMREVAEVEGF